MDITQITQAIAAAETTSNKQVQQLSNGETEAILTFATRVAAQRTAIQLREAGATKATITRSPYGESILVARWVA